MRRALEIGSLYLNLMESGHYEHMESGQCQYVMPRWRMALGCLASVASAVILSISNRSTFMEPSAIWLVFGGFCIFALFGALFTVVPPKLVLDHEGFYRVSPFRGRTGKVFWHHVERFEVVTIAGFRRLTYAVGIVYRPEHSRSGPIIPLVIKINDVDAYVPMTWPRSVSLIVNEFNDYRLRALASKAPFHV